jgi:hypothetical protein
MRRCAEIESAIAYKAEHRTTAITSKVATATASTPCSLPPASTALVRQALRALLQACYRRIPS